ncbi:MAG: hypothetical protein IPO89_13300 [Actinomycetales bacterium]|nr:hypothetical protein [Candidatus Lutibacillus vidarii]
MNAHINADLPQALLAVISEADFADAALMESRRRDHERIDEILLSRVGSEDDARRATIGAGPGARPAQPRGDRAIPA